MPPSKQRKKALSVADLYKAYPLAEALELVKKMSYTKFDASVDIAIRLGIDPRKSEQMLRGTVKLPQGTGKNPTILVLCNEDKVAEATSAGADHVGLQDYIDKIEKGWTAVDVIITEPSLMAKLAKLGRTLGPRGLMPNPKSGTVTHDIGKAVAEAKGGKIDLKSDKYGIVHASIGRCSFEAEALLENAQELLQTTQRLKPSSAKGTYIRSIYVSSTMGPSLEVDKQSLPL